MAPAAAASASTVPPPSGRYAVGMLGLSIPSNLIKGSMLLFYVDILGLDVAAYGIVMTVYAFLDALEAPVLGWLADRTRTRWGRRKPYILAGSCLLATGTVAFFFTPVGLSSTSLLIWFTVCLLITEFSNSMVSSNYGALLPELFPAESQRARANSARQGYQLVAMVLALALTPLLTTKLLGTDHTTGGFRVTALLYAAIALGALLIMTFGITENPQYGTEAQARVWTTLREIVSDRLFWLVGLASAAYLTPMAMVLAGVQLYVKYALGRPISDALYLQGSVILVAALFLAIWGRVVTRSGAPRVWRACFAILAIGFAPLLFIHDLVSATVAGCVVAVGWAGLMVTNDLVQARLLDEDARRHGVHREGLFLAAFGFFGRLAFAIDGLALASLGWFFGYHSGDAPGTDPGAAFRLYMSAYPAAIALLGLGLALICRLPAAGAAPAPAGRGPAAVGRSPSPSPTD